MNMWQELISDRGISLIEEAGYKVSGNWLREERRAEPEEAKPDFAVIAPINDIKFSHSIEKIKCPYAVWVLFPDDIAGWDFRNRRYLFEKQEPFITAIEGKKRAGSIYTNSLFTRRLVNKTYGIDEGEMKVCYPGIDTVGLLNADSRRNSDGIHVLWNHKWRSDKGFDTALGIIERLSREFPDTFFTLGSRERWCDEDALTEEMKAEYMGFIKKTEGRRNIRVIPTFEGWEEYCSSLSEYDISFSVSPHETFGLGMMEASLKHATILPRWEVYPEIYRENLSDNVEEDVKRLILERDIREKVAIQRRRVALNYDVSRTVESLVRMADELTD